MYDFRKTEAEILDFWHKNNIFEKSTEARKGKKNFVFFEGPPTANNLPHIGHFLTRVYKDLYGRYKTMRGFFVSRKAGWDTHGLPVEIEIEKKLGFKNKKDIENFGIGKFNKKAKESAWQYVRDWEEMTRKMGFWVDMKHPYITYENNYIESVWNIIQQIWNKKLLYLAHKVVPFCVRCGTPLSSHEVAQGYKLVKDRSVYIKFKILSPKFKNTFILAWTTTPWTLPGNVALAIGKSIKYQVVSIKGKSENYILAEDLVGKVLNTEYLIHDTILGSELVGLEYEPLFNIKELRSVRSHRVYEADFVSTTDGTGVVHTAVMYGEDDYVLGTKLGLPKFHTVNEQGKFVGVGKDFDGMIVKHKDGPTEEKTTQKVIDYLKEKNILFKEENYEHDYPFCWRCDSPLIYYAKTSWFIKMSAVKEKLLKNNSKVNWIPEHIKEGRFGQWLKEGKDWAFSRERYWGTPLPVWKCQKCENQKVIGSVAELEKYSTGAIKKRNKYYILRHGYTTRDERGKMIISSDVKSDKYHLTAEGQKQIQKIAESIKNNHEIELIYSSPFLRTSETSEIVAKLIHVKVHKDDRLREIGHGDCEDKPHRNCPFIHIKKEIDTRQHELGESWDDVRKRMVEFMNDMESKYSGKTILIVSHGDPLWLLSAAAQGATADEIVKDSRNEHIGYPNIAELGELKWRSIPRNEDGELDLHRPFIDDVYLKCDECGASMKKVPDLIDVWFDSGAMPYAQWHWPFENKKLFESQFPAEFIVEAIDQTRGWFYTLLAISTLLGREAPYKNVMVLGHTLDEKGAKMSKSKGNFMAAIPSIEKYGADIMRWYFLSSMPMGESKSIVPREIEDKLKGFIFTLQNCVRFYELYGEGAKVFTHSSKVTNLLDKWILSRFNNVISEVTLSLDKYDPTTASRAIEKFVVEDLSNWWLRRSRKRKEALGLLRFLLLELSKVISPFTPFIAEDIFRRLATHNSRLATHNSVHLEDWPKDDKKSVNKKLEEEMTEVRNVVTSGLAVRKEGQLKVRQPLRSATIKRSSKLSSDLEELVKEELNVKKLIYDKKQEKTVTLDIELDPSLINEGYARELIRQVQDMRKEAKYKLDAKIFGQWHSDDTELSAAINEWTEEIKKEALLKEFTSGPPSAGSSLQRGEVRAGKKSFDVAKEMELAPSRKIWVGVRK